MTTFSRTKIIFHSSFITFDSPLLGPAKKDPDWGVGASTGTAGGWGDPRSGDPRQPGGMDPRGPDMRTANADPMRLLDPREQMRQMGGGGDMRGDPRGKAYFRLSFLLSRML